jgi:Acetyltransferase (GNAT) domain
MSFRPKMGESASSIRGILEAAGRAAVTDPVSLCAEAVAGWHTSWLTALGIKSAREGDHWRALQKPPLIYFAGITLGPDTSAEAIADVPGSICDTWQTLDLGPNGFRVWRTEPWFYRPTGLLSLDAPPELDVVPVSTAAEVLEFESVSVKGFGGEDDSIEPGTYHPPAILEDHSMKMFVGRVDGRDVGAAMGYLAGGVVGVFGVTTVASARGRGYGSALTRAAMLTESGLPSVLAPSPEGERLYRRLGFAPVGALSIWVREGPGP